MQPPLEKEQADELQGAFDEPLLLFSADLPHTTPRIASETLHRHRLGTAPDSAEENPLEPFLPHTSYISLNPSVEWTRNVTHSTESNHPTERTVT